MNAEKIQYNEVESESRRYILNKLINEKRIGLTFPKMLEHEFQQHYVDQYHNLVFLGLVVGTVVYTFSVIFEFLFAKNLSAVLIVRYAFVTPTTIFMLISSYFVRKYSWQQFLVTIGIIAISIGIWLSFYYETGPLKELYCFAPIILLVYLGAPTYVCFRFALLIVIINIVIAILALNIDQTVAYFFLVTYIYILIAASVMAAFSNYFSERARRQQFLQTSLIDYEKKELLQALDEKKMLLREMHHRVKNNLQIIIALLELEEQQITDETCLRILSDNKNRMNALAVIHEKIYGADNLFKINMNNYIGDLALMIVSALQKQNAVRLKVEIDDKIELTPDAAVHIGLIVSELVTNSLKHAFPDDQKNALVQIKLYKNEKGNLELVVSDNGMAFPKKIDLAEIKTLGLTLVKQLTKQLHGTFDLSCDNGVTVKIIMGKI
ncbi:MAG: sensor histidine kinase [Gammaproteobacteria bacterium]|jgi:two-component sensor histidine kinase